MTAAWTLTGFGDEIDDDPAIQLAVLRALGASHLELRSAWGTNVAALDDEQVGRLQAMLAHYEVGVSAIGSPIGKAPVDAPVEDEVARLDRVIDVALRLGAPYVRMFSFWPPGSTGEGDPAAGSLPDDVAAAMRDGVLTRLRALADLAERRGIVLVHENEKGIYGDVPTRILDLVESVGSDALRLAWDNANYVQCGVRPFTEAWPLLADHVVYLQVKDAVAATGRVVVAGEGDGELLETVTALRDRGYAGFASLEPHLVDAAVLGGFSGPERFGAAARAFRAMTDRIGVELS